MNYGGLTEQSNVKKTELYIHSYYVMSQKKINFNDIVLCTTCELVTINVKQSLVQSIFELQPTTCQICRPH